MNKFTSQIVDNNTFIQLENKPTLIELQKLEIFLRKKSGEFISPCKQHFRILRKFTESQMELIFKENKLNYYSKYKKKDIPYPAPENIKLEPEDSIITFGMYKGKTFGQLDDKYLTWLKETHFDREVKKLANLVLESRNTVYIDINKYV